MTWNGPDPDLRKGPNRTIAKGPNVTLRQRASSAGNCAKGPNPSNAKGPAGHARGSIYAQMQRGDSEQAISTRGS